MFNTCCCGKDPQCTDQKYFTCGALQKGGLEYNTGEVTGPSAFTFPERAMKVTGHCSLQRDSRVVSASSLQTSRMLPQSLPSIAQRSSGWQGDSLSSTRPCFPPSCKGTSSDRLSLQVDTRRLLMPIQAGT